MHACDRVRWILLQVPEFRFALRRGVDWPVPENMRNFPMNRKMPITRHTQRGIGFFLLAFIARSHFDFHYKDALRLKPQENYFTISQRPDF
jgi:hypothetical protein